MRQIGQCLFCSLLDPKAQRRLEAQQAEHAQGVFLKAGGWVSHRRQELSLEVLFALEGIDEALAKGIVPQGVDGEVATG